MAVKNTKMTVGCNRLRSLSHGGASGSKPGSQGLAPSASRRPKQACLNYSRDEMLTVYESCAELAVPDGLRALPDIAVEQCQPPLASIPPSPEEQVPVIIVFMTFAEAYQLAFATIIRPHRSTMYVDASYCYRLSRVVCVLVCLYVGEPGTVVSPEKKAELECGPMPNIMVALPNIGGALCSTPQRLARASCLSAVQ